MAKVHEKTTTPSTFKPKSTTTCLGCFRFSNKKTLPSHDYDNNNKSTSRSSRRSSRSSWFCWSRFRMNKSSATKTVPLDISAVCDKQAPIPNNRSLEPKSKQLVSKHQLVAATPNQREASVLPRIVDSDKTPNSEAAKPADQEAAADTINLENRRLGALKDDLCQKRRLSFCRKVESIRTGGGSRSSSQPGSPVQPEKKPRPRSGTTGTSAAISPSASPKRQRRARKTWFMSNERTMTSANKLDPLVGMTVIMVTLIIMLLWGRLCAILSTAAWFYLIPRLTNSNSSSTAGNTFPHPRVDDLDFNSDEYKKKVVLEGFLERNNHRNHLL